MGPIAPDSANKTTKATGISRTTTDHPATAPSPKGAIAWVTKALPTGVAIWVRTAGKPMAIKVGRVSRSTATLGRRSKSCFFSTIHTPNTTSAERAHHWDNAAPSSPNPRPKMHSGSSTALAAPLNRVSAIAPRASPTDRSSALQHMPMPIKGAVGRTWRA